MILVLWVDELRMSQTRPRTGPPFQEKHHKLFFASTLKCIETIWDVFHEGTIILVEMTHQTVLCFLCRFILFVCIITRIRCYSSSMSLLVPGTATTTLHVLITVVSCIALFPSYDIVQGRPADGEDFTVHWTWRVVTLVHSTTVHVLPDRETENLRAMATLLHGNVDEPTLYDSRANHRSQNNKYTQ